MAKRVSEDEILERFRIAWREMQRGSAIRKVEARARENHDEIDLRQTDALGVVVATGGCRMSDVSEALGMDASNASRTVLRLVRNGYIKRSPAPDDGRAVLLTVTKAGLKTWNEVNDRRTEAVKHVISKFGRNDVLVAIDVLETVVNGLNDFVDNVLQDSTGED